MRAIGFALSLLFLTARADAQPPPGALVAQGRDLIVIQPQPPIAIPDIRAIDQPNLSNVLPGILLPDLPPMQPMMLNGREAFAGEAPWQVELRFTGELSAPAPGTIARPEWSRRHLCGGTLIAPDWVLTAAHCLFDHKTDPPRLRADSELGVRAGLHDISEDAGETRKVTAFVHPQFRGSLKPSADAPLGAPAANDFALLRLDQPMPEDPFGKIAPVSLAPQINGLHPGDALTLYGWGARSPDDKMMSQTLQTASLSLVGHTKCNAVYTPANAPPVISASVLCAIGKTESGLIVDSCTGDSGGAVLRFDGADFVPVGVASWGSCGQGRPSIYGMIDSVREWIADTIREQSGGVP